MRTDIEHWPESSLEKPTTSFVHFLLHNPVMSTEDNSVKLVELHACEELFLVRTATLAGPDVRAVGVPARVALIVAGITREELVNISSPTMLVALRPGRDVGEGWVWLGTMTAVARACEELLVGATTVLAVFRSGGRDGERRIGFWTVTAVARTSEELVDIPTALLTALRP